VVGPVHTERAFRGRGRDGKSEPPRPLGEHVFAKTTQAG